MLTTEHSIQVSPSPCCGGLIRLERRGTKESAVESDKPEAVDETLGSMEDGGVTTALGSLQRFRLFLVSASTGVVVEDR